MWTPKKSGLWCRKHEGLWIPAVCSCHPPLKSKSKTVQNHLQSLKASRVCEGPLSKTRHTVLRCWTKDKFAIWTHVKRCLLHLWITFMEASFYVTCPISSLQVLLRQGIKVSSSCWEHWNTKRTSRAKSKLCDWISGSAGNRWPCGYQNSAPHIRAGPRLN